MASTQARLSSGTEFGVCDQFLTAAVQLFVTAGVRAASFFSFMDPGSSLCLQEAHYYGPNPSPAFVEYLCSTGLIAYDATPKAAYSAYLQAFKAIAELRE